MSDREHDFDARGYVVARQVCAAVDCDVLADELDESAELSRRRGGLRLSLEQAGPQLTKIARSVLRQLVAQRLGRSCFPVRAILFDKTRRSNWKVAWHQDLTIAVASRSDLPGFGPWTIKNGMLHVQPPMAILERMATVRLHLDDCGCDNGPLRVIPGSHLSGRLSPQDVAAWRTKGPETACIVRRGDAVLMRPLLLHASSPAATPDHRRVLHVEYASEPLPGQLEWSEMTKLPTYQVTNLPSHQVTQCA